MSSDSGARRRRPSRRTVAVLCAIAGAGVVSACWPGGPAAPTRALPPSPSAADLAAAERTARSDASTAFAARFFVHLDQRAGNLPVSVARDDIDRAAAAKAVIALGPARPLYTLNPAAVAKASADQPIAVLKYLAVEARSVTGQQATVEVIRRDGRYLVEGVAEGIGELAYARAHPDQLVFNEPQKQAWYALDHDRVLALDADARASLGRDVMAAADFRRLVHQRYVGKLPGTDYDRDHKIG